MPDFDWANPPLGCSVSLPGYFDAPVVLEEAQPVGNGFKCRVRLLDGTIVDLVISADEMAVLASHSDADEHKSTRPFESPCDQKTALSIAFEPGSDSRPAIRSKGFALAEWQNDAVSAWLAGDGGSPYRGTLEIFTGGGKTLIALVCAEKAASMARNLKIVVVVPTEALVDQWIDNFTRFTDIDPLLIGQMGGGRDDTLVAKRVLICVLNSASKRLPALISDAASTLLIVDECHRAGAPTFSRVLNTPARFRLGLSATPEREELDEDGAQVEFDEQVVGRALGGLVFRFTIRDARRIGWLPAYELHHHGVELLSPERQKYDEESRKIDDIADRLGEHGIEVGRVRQACMRNDESGALAHAYIAATSRRKDLLYRATERSRVTAQVVRQIVARRAGARILLFHERINEAAALHALLVSVFPERRIALEHSQMASGERKKALAAFKDNSVSILVSVKSLVEGIDVPDADVGISVASSSSVRQRVQSLGRVLRRSFDVDKVKVAEMHLVYVADTVDESIYSKEDWTDLTGADANRYWLWPQLQTSPQSLPAPPRTPAPTEEQEWDRLGRAVSETPQPWLGLMPGLEYSVDVRGNISTPTGRSVTNPQGVGGKLAALRGKPGGRFCVTPLFRLVLVRQFDGPPYVVGRLTEPFTIPNVSENSSAVDVSNLKPGEPYGGPADKSNGSFKLSQKRGGVIERRDKKTRSTEFAIVSGGSSPTLEENARRILEEWRRLLKTGIEFHVNSLWHAWYQQDGQARFLGVVKEGFSWPLDEHAADFGEIK